MKVVQTLIKVLISFCCIFSRIRFLLGLKLIFSTFEFSFLVMFINFSLLRGRQTPLSNNKKIEVATNVIDFCFQKGVKTSDFPAKQKKLHIYPFFCYLGYFFLKVIVLLRSYFCFCMRTSPQKKVPIIRCQSSKIQRAIFFFFKIQKLSFFKKHVSIFFYFL